MGQHILQNMQCNMIMSKLIIFFGCTIPLIQLYLTIAFKEWWKSPRRKPGGCLIFGHVSAFWCLMPIKVSVLLPTQVLMPIGRPHIIWSTATQPPYTPLEPRRVPATALLPSSSLYLSAPSLHPHPRLSSPPLPGALSHSSGLHTEPHCVRVLQSTQSGLISDTHTSNRVCAQSHWWVHTHTHIPS